MNTTSECTVYRKASIILGSSISLGPAEIDRLLGALKQTPPNARSPLAGRTTASIRMLPGVGEVVIKHYRRGGLARLIFSDRYLYLNRRRCRIEYDMLCRVRSLNVQAAQPVLWAFDKGFLYRCWLVTKAIPSSVTLADLSRSDPGTAVCGARQAAEQIRKLIRHRILHVDLHPGNVLVGKDGQVYLIDFDRACRYHLGKARLYRRYRRRWQRAVVKHGLPDFLITEMESGLSNAPEVP